MTGFHALLGLMVCGLGETGRYGRAEVLGRCCIEIQALDGWLHPSSAPKPDDCSTSARSSRRTRTKPGFRASPLRSTGCKADGAAQAAPDQAASIGTPRGRAPSWARPLGEADVPGRRAPWTAGHAAALPGTAWSAPGCRCTSGAQVLLRLQRHQPTRWRDGQPGAALGQRRKVVEVPGRSRPAPRQRMRVETQPGRAPVGRLREHCTRVDMALLTPQGPRQSSAAAATDGQPPPTPVTRRTRCARMRHPARA